MNKLVFLLAMIICFSLCACNIGVSDAQPAALDVQIAAGKIEAGMSPSDVNVEVTIDGQPVECKVELTRFTNDGFYVMAEDEAVPEDFFGRLDVYYSLPEGVDLEGIDVVMECDGGEYDGTGSVGDDANGCVVAWSHAIYGEEAKILNVQIAAGKIEAGMSPSDVTVEVTIDGQPVECKVELTRFTNDGFYVMAEDEAVPEDFFGRLDVYYSLPEGVDLEGIDVVMECDGGEYDGTGSVGDDANGCVVAWSHAIYGEEPQSVTEYEPTPQPESKPDPKPEPEPEPEQEPPHTHSWKESPSQSMSAGCDFAGYTTYVCSCGETKRETIEALGHDLKEGELTPPTCTEPGKQVTSCTRCGAGFINEIPANGHSWSGWTQENGRVHKRSCSVCGAEEEENHSIPSGSVTCTGCGADIVN